jgi:hypothetical protein
MPPITRQYQIDLQRAPAERWAEAAHAERDAARAMVADYLMMWQNGARARAGPVGRPVVELIRHAAVAAVRTHGLRRAAEIRAWADATDLRPLDLTFANLAYEMIQFLLYPVYLPMGCTAAAFDLPEAGGPVLVRNLDWPQLQVGRQSLLYHFKGPAGPFTAVSWPSYLGVVSGLAPGRFAATINHIPQRHPLRPRRSPLSLLRDVFERCRSWQEAADTIRCTPLSVAALFTVVGVNPGEAVAIEHPGAPRQARVRQAEDGLLIVCNDYRVPALRHLNKRRKTPMSDDALSWSQRRINCAFDALAGRRPRTFAETVSVLDEYPACNDFTAQQMVFVPRTGEYVARYNDIDPAVRALLG